MTRRHADQLRDHWWPRPGWRPGRTVLTWHVTFADAPALHQLAAACHEALAGLPAVRSHPVEWLHLTVQKIGYGDETPTVVTDAVVAAVRERLATVPAFTLTFGRPLVLSEAVVLVPEPVEPTEQVLAAVRAGIADAAGPDALPSPSPHWFPHVTVAYSYADADSTPYVAAVEAMTAEPVAVPITKVTLIRQERVLAPDWCYRWTPAATANLA